MATTPPQEPRKVSLSITIRIGSIPQDVAQKIEDAVRDLLDDYGADVQAVRGREQPPRI
jgi:hypothetical protein